MTWAELTSHPPSALQELHDNRLSQAGVRLWLKRDDLLAPAPDDPFCGNKWRKLKYNLLAFRAGDYSAILSFGGNHSNHIAALASAGAHFGIPTIGIIRGEDIATPTLLRARKDGMALHFISRSAYRAKHQPEEIEKYRQTFGAIYLVPEGGSNTLALQGCAELATETVTQLGFAPDYLTLPCGTGGTLAGLAVGAPAAVQLLGFAVVKGDFLASDVEQFLQASGQTAPAIWHIQPDYHCGGYARWTPELLAFSQSFTKQHGILLDPVYGAKHFYGLFDLIKRGYFAPGCRIVALHTGGLQGVAGFEQRFGEGWHTDLHRLN